MERAANKFADAQKRVPPETATDAVALQLP
jgi:hypothetical protein